MGWGVDVVHPVQPRNLGQKKSRFSPARDVSVRNWGDTSHPLLDVRRYIGLLEHPVSDRATSPMMIPQEQVVAQASSHTHRCVPHVWRGFNCIHSCGHRIPSQLQLLRLRTPRLRLLWAFSGLLHVQHIYIFCVSEMVVEWTHMESRFGLVIQGLIIC